MNNLPTKTKLSPVKLAVSVTAAVLGIGLVVLAAGYIINPDFLKRPKVQKNTSKETIQPIQTAASCFIDLDGKVISISNSNDSYVNSFSDCKNLFLANYFLTKGQRSDLFLLLKDLGKTSAFTQSELNNSTNVKVYYLDQNGKQDYFSDYIEKKLKADKCTELGYWNVPLYCFNEIPNSKPSHLAEIIRYLTFLKITQKDQQYVAFYTLLNYDIAFVDDWEDTCSKSATNFVSGDPPKIEFHQSFFNEFKKVHAAGVIYHETTHLKSKGHYYFKMPDGQCTQNSNTSGSDVSTEVDANSCPKSISQGMSADWDIEKNKNKSEGWNISVYGAQIDYLNTLVSDKDLNCQDRKDAYADFKFNLDHLCNVPKYDVTEPVCN